MRNLLRDGDKFTFAIPNRKSCYALTKIKRPCLSAEPFEVLLPSKHIYANRYNQRLNTILNN
ncbi:hypothetical protein Asal01_02225 [Fodinibius salicampi]